MEKLLSIAAIVVFLSVLGLSRADYWPGDAEFQTICGAIIDEVYSNQYFRRGLNGQNQIVVHETLTQQQLCDRLVIQHNLNNLEYLGYSIVSSDECVGALNAPDFYPPASWNKWRGRHCGHWRAVDANGAVGPPSVDDALWNYAHLSSGVYYRQSVDFFGRESCCEDGWNESGGSEVVVWGWDPKDSTNHFGYQGCHVGWPFTSASGADCIVWLTGEEGFLECIKTVGSSKRRTSAGFWGFGQWIVQTSNTQFCQSSIVNSKRRPHLSPVHLPPNTDQAIP